jgi:hypothetical protein
MQLHLRRSQRDGGVISKNVIFCLDAQAAFTREEDENIRRYKLHNQCIYNSEASKRMLDRADTASDGSTRGALKSLAFSALAAMRLNITVNSLARGQHIECKSLDELLAAEEALYEACRNLKQYLDTAATFDGREVVIDYSQPEQPQIVAQAQPAQILVATPVPVAAVPAAAIAAPAPTVEAVIPEPQPTVATAHEPDDAAVCEAAPEKTSAYAPSYGEVDAGTGRFFSDGAQGETEKKIMIGVGIFFGVILLFSCMT